MNIEKTRTKKDILKEIEKLQEEIEDNYNDYETIIILNDTITHTNYNNIINKIKEITQDVIEIKDIGTRQLAYKIKQHSHGFYCQIDWNGSSETLKALESFLNDNKDNEGDILKFLTLKQNY